MNPKIHTDTRTDIKTPSYCSVHYYEKMELKYKRGDKTLPYLVHFKDGVPCYGSGYKQQKVQGA